MFDKPVALDDILVNLDYVFVFDNRLVIIVHIGLYAFDIVFDILVPMHRVYHFPVLHHQYN